MNRINLEQMRNMSIDEIINLYKNGYRLEDNASFESFDPPVDPFVNFGKVTVSAGYNNTDTNIILNSGNGSILPDTSLGQYNLVWWNSTDYYDPSDDPNKEIIRVISKTGDTLNIVRGQESTISSPKNLAGKTYMMINALTQKTIIDLQNVPARSLQNSSGTIDISTSPPPATGQILTAISPSSATWQSLAPPQCFFVTIVASPTFGTFPLTVNYNSTVIGGVAPYTYLWNFGDGNTSTLSATNHMFTVNGIYTTSLTVTDSVGNNASSATTITVTTGIGIVATGLGVTESISLPDRVGGIYNAGPFVVDSYFIVDSVTGISNVSAGIDSSQQDSIAISDSVTGISNDSAGASSPVQDSISQSELLTIRNT